METYELIDNAEAHSYEYHLGEHKAKIEYLKSNHGEIYLTHTEVPQALEGRGIGSALLADVLRVIDGQGLRLVPLCPFVAGYIRKHPQWKRLIKQGVNV